MPQPTISRDNASVVGRVVGFSEPSEPVEMSQMSYPSQSSVTENQESSSTKSSRPTMLHSQNYPPLHQNSSSSNASSNSSCYSRSQQSRFAANLSKMNQRFEKRSQQFQRSDSLSHCNSSTHNSASTSAASRSVHDCSVHSKGGPKSTLLQRMNPRRIGSSTTPLLQQQGPRSQTTRHCLPSNLLSHHKVRQNSASSVALPGTKSSSSSNSSSSFETANAEKHVNGNQQVLRLQSELKAFVDKSMKSIREKSTELDRKKSELEEESKNRQKEQDELFQGRLHELNDAFDSKAVNLNQLFDEHKSHLEHENATWIESIQAAGDSQVQRLSEYSQATLKKFHGAAKTADSFLRAYKQNHTETIQSLPGMIRPMLSQMMNSMLNSNPTESMVADTTTSGFCKPSSASIKNSSIGNKVVVPTSKVETGNRGSCKTKRRRASAPCCEIGPSQTTAATGPDHRLRRSKRIKKDSSDKENLTPTSKSGRARPCVTPGATSNEDQVRINLSIPSPSPKKPLARREPKDTSTRGKNKRKKSSCKSSVTPLNSKTVPSEVELSNLQDSSPLSQLSGHHQPQRNISRPKGSTLKREKRRKSYGRVRAPKKPALTNYMSDDTFSFASDGIKP